MLSPDVRVQTESKKCKNSGGAGAQSDSRKKSIIDSGIELLFKKSHSKNAGVGAGGGVFGQSPPKMSHPLSSDYYKFSSDTTTVPANYVEKESTSHQSSALDEHHKWKLFDTIKIHTDKRRSFDPNGMYLKQEFESRNFHYT